MASVTSLDHDMRKLRLDRYTPGAANDVRKWIEDTLNEKIASGDLMEALKDGVALCKLVNLVASPGVRYKASSMPFVQMENISHFLKACEMPPLSLPSHDRFLTVDLFDQKDPAQVLQCIAAFSRRANSVNPDAFSTTIGVKSKGGAMSPQGTGGSHKKSPSYTINTPPPKPEPAIAFNPLNRSAYSGRSSPTKQGSLGRGGLASPGPVSSWSNKNDETKTAPAWNIHQYGYMGGASQGNQGVAFGARRQITSAAPDVPSLEAKEQRLREKEQEQRDREEDEVRKQRDMAEQEEAQAREEEEQRWAEQTQELKNRETQEAERLKRDKEANEAKALEAKLTSQRAQQRQVSDSRLNGQFLSQYRNAENETTQQSSESQRIADLERQLLELKEADRKRQQEETQRQQQHQDTPPPVKSLDAQKSHEDDWDASEREYLRQQNQVYKQIATEESANPRAQPIPSSAASDRPLPDPIKYISGTNRTDRYLSSYAAPQAAPTTTHRADNFGTTTEVDIENERRVASQQKTKAGAWASKSILEREMERERERQREWEENQKATATRPRDPNSGSAPGQTWDVHQYGYMGGDNQNRGGPGLGIGGARRQIIGPRPPP